MDDSGIKPNRNYTIPPITELTEMVSSAFAENGLKASDTQYGLLAKYLEYMLTVNKTLNLTAIREPSEAVYKHLCDSAMTVSHIPNGSNLIDVGSGAGLPAVPIAILRPDVSVTALDSTAKKINFIADTARILNLDNLNVKVGRAEELGHDLSYRGKFDVVTARAVARLNILAEICMPFLKKGGKFLSLKSRLTDEEITEAHRAITALGGKVESADRFTLRGIEDAERSVISILKTASTPERYPRVYTLISSKPL